MVEPLGVALLALDLGRAGVGTTAAVLWSGPIGLLLLQALGVVGATTILATDRLSHRVAVAAAMGATHALDASRVAVELSEVEFSGVAPGYARAEHSRQG